MLRKNRKKLISLLLLILLAVLVIRVNQVTKTVLVSRNGQTFEKAVVEEIDRRNDRRNSLCRYHSASFQ